MRHRLHGAGIHTLPTRVLESLDRYRMIATDLGEGRRRVAMTTPRERQMDLFRGLGVPRPGSKEVDAGLTSDAGL
jgi:hypothetical protein